VCVFLRFCNALVYMVFGCLQRAGEGKNSLMVAMCYLMERGLMPVRPFIFRLAVDPSVGARRQLPCCRRVEKIRPGGLSWLVGTAMHKAVIIVGCGITSASASALSVGWFVGGILLVFPVLAEEGNYSGQVSDEQIIQPDVRPRRVREDLIDTENFEIGLFSGVLSVEDFGANFVYGASLAWHISEDLFFQANAGVSDTGETSFERLGGDVRILENNDRELLYYNLSLGYKVLPGEAFFGSDYAFNTNFYLVAGLGSTKFGGDDRLTANFGWGYQVLFTDWLSLHLAMRDHVFDSDILGEDKTTHNLEFTAGLSVFF
jgi:outer membrane beta-barrel protein